MNPEPAPPFPGETTEDRILGGRVRLPQPKHGYRAGLDAALVEGAKRLGFPGCGVDGAFLDALVELFEATRSTSARSPRDVG